MEEESKKQRPSWVKLLVFAIIAGVLWFVFQSDVVLNALLAFFFAGVVPGTNTVITPQDMMRGAVVAAIVIFVGIITYSVIKHIVVKRAIRRLGLKPDYTARAVVQPLVVTKKNKKPTTKKSKDPVVVKIRPKHTTPALFTWFEQNTPKFARKASGLVSKFIRRSANVVWQIVKRIARYTKRTIIYTAKASKNDSIAFWQWLEPHLRHADAWLEAHVKAIVHKITKRLKRSDNFKFILSLVSQLKTRAKTVKSRLFTKL